MVVVGKVTVIEVPEAVIVAIVAVVAVANIFKYNSFERANCCVTA